MTGNMMQNVSNGQMHNGMDQQLQQQQQMMQQQQATYDVLDNAGYCSPSNGELMVITSLKLSISNTLCNSITGQQSSHASVMSPNNNSCHSTISNHSANMHMSGQQPGQPSSFYQYFTPPSQHSGGATPQHLAQTLDSYPTPSPESPGDWSSSSPHSNSDWSEGVQSPAANNVYVTSTGHHQANKGSEAIYI